ncbi:hypothetical protein DRP04_02915 [Archaeoglobales archaeon]|nr:MAG: hypothetical protein DRP04_02915 [Archaeoglobales archaeon]
MRVRSLSFIGIILFLILLFKLQPTNVVRIILEANITYFIASLLVFPVLFLVAGLKWKIIVDAHGLNCSFRRTLIASIVGYTAGVLTPGRLGDFVKALYLKPLGKAVSTVFVEKVLSVISVLLIALVCTPTALKVRFELTIVLLTGIIASSILLFLIGKRDRHELEFFFKFIPESMRGSLKNAFDEFLEGLFIANEKKLLLLMAFLLSILHWVLGSLQVYLLASSLGVNVGFISILAMVCLAVALSFLPVSIFGIGTRDVTYVLFLTQLGIDAVRALSLSILAMFLYVSTVPLGITLWYLYPPSFKNIH